MVIEPDFAERDNLFVCEKLFKRKQHLVRHFGGVMRMHTDSRIYKRIFLRQLDRLIRIAQVAAYVGDILYAVFVERIDYFTPVGAERLVS